MKVKKDPSQSPAESEDPEDAVPPVNKKLRHVHFQNADIVISMLVATAHRDR